MKLRICLKHSLILALISLIVFAALTSCNSQKNKSANNKVENASNLKAEDFSHLQEQLFALSVADNPESYAQKFLLDFEDGKIWVKLQLKSDTESLPPGYAMTVHVRSGQFLEVQVELKDLRKLSQEPQVEYISPLQKPQP